MQTLTTARECLANAQDETQTLVARIRQASAELVAAAARSRASIAESQAVIRRVNHDLHTQPAEVILYPRG